MNKDILMISLCIFGLSSSGCNYQDEQLAPTPQSEATHHVSKDMPAESDFDEAVNVSKMNLVDTFLERLRSENDISDLLTSEIYFHYESYSDCAAVTSGHIERLSADKIDRNFFIPVRVDWQNPDCETPQEREFELTFNVKDIVADWIEMRAVADDDNFESFYIAEPGSSESLMIHIMNSGDGYKISKLEYRHYFMD